MREKSDLSFGNVGKVRLACWNMLEKSDMSVGDKLHQPGRLVLRHPVQISEFGDSFLQSVRDQASYVSRICDVRDNARCVSRLRDA